MGSCIRLSCTLRLRCVRCCRSYSKMLLGNFENSDALGFNMTVGSVESWSGVDTKKLSESQKQLLYLKYILDQTSSSVGRAEQETDSWQGRLKNLQAT